MISILCTRWQQIHGYTSVHPRGSRYLADQRSQGINVVRSGSHRMDEKNFSLSQTFPSALSRIAHVFAKTTPASSRLEASRKPASSRMALTTSLSLTFIWHPYVSMKNDPVSPPLGSLTSPAIQWDALASAGMAWSSLVSSRSHVGVGQLISLCGSEAVNTLLLALDSSLARKSRNPGPAVVAVVVAAAVAGNALASSALDATIVAEPAVVDAAPAAALADVVVVGAAVVALDGGNADAEC